MNWEYEFDMPWPPTVNHWHQPCKGRIIKGAKAREYTKKAVEHIKGLGLSGEMLTNQIKILMVLHPPTNARYDIDNRTKGVFDALSEAKFWADDSQVVDLQIKKKEKVKDGMVRIYLSIDEN